MTASILVGDCRWILATLPAQSVHCCITSPPYWGLRDYGVDGQIGLEASVETWVDELVTVFREVRRVLRDDGTLWLNLGDSYADSGRGGNSAAITGIGKNASQVDGRTTRSTGLKPKDLIGQPWRIAFALRAGWSRCAHCNVERRADKWPVWNGVKVCIDCIRSGYRTNAIDETEPGWYLRQENIWHKPNPMPESIRDRCTKAHEQVFLLSKLPRYYFDFEAMQEPVNGGAHARRQKTPDGWDTSKGEGGHGSIHKLGREKGFVPEVGRREGLPGNPAERKLAEAGRGTKNNTSMDEALAVMPDTRNKRSVWTVPSEPFKEAHFATFPTKLIELCVLAGCPVGGTVLDSFGGAGTTGLVAERNGRDSISIELNPDYAAMARSRIDNDMLCRQGSIFKEVACSTPP